MSLCGWSMRLEATRSSRERRRSDICVEEVVRVLP